MRIAETVTFGGSGLERAAELRARADDIAALLARDDARVLPFWRGRPLVQTAPQPTATGGGLVWVAPDHPALVADGGFMIFLGLEDGAGRFAQDISAWVLADSVNPLAGGPFDPGSLSHPGFGSDAHFADLRSVMSGLSPRAAECAVMAKAVLAWHETHSFCARCGHPSSVTHAGWQRHCSACDTHHFPRTDPVVIMLVTRGNSLLLGRSAVWPEGMYSLLAGFIEPGETIEAAVRREVGEETGVKIGAVRYLASQPWPFPASLMLGCQADALTSDITLDPAELEDAQWLTREEVAQVAAGTHPTIRPSRRGSIAQFLITHWLADRLD